MRLLVFGPVAAALLVLSGCMGVLGTPGDGKPTDWFIAREDSMFPDFSKEGHDSYPVLIVHKHEMPSERQQEQRRKEPTVVCWALDGAGPLATFGPAATAEAKPSAAPSADAAMAPCMPAANPSAGRLLVERSTFEQWDARAVVLTDISCPDAVPLDRDQPGFFLRTIGHQFRTELLANDTFLVDGAWYLEPGQALKITYTADYGPAQDDRLVKAVFDYPGRWLVSMVGPHQDWEPVLPPRPDHGDGPVAWVPMDPSSLADVLSGGVADATPGQDPAVTSFRAVVHRGNLVDLRVDIATTDGVTTWFPAARERDGYVMIGRDIGAVESPGVAVSAFESAFDVEVFAFYSGGFDPESPVVVEWAPEVRLEPDPVLGWRTSWLPTVRPCDGDCAHVWTEDAQGQPKWFPVESPNHQEAIGALTLQASWYATETQGDGKRVWYHVPSAD